MPVKSGGSRQQLPVLRHNDRVDVMDDTIRCSNVALPDVRTIGSSV
jgi:hypothetical protein